MTAHTIRHLAGFGALTPAEEKLLSEIDTGEFCVIGDGKLPPEGAGEDRRIRAAFLRYLLLGGCSALERPVHEKGVRVQGAFVTGVLDLEGCRIPRDIGLIESRFDAAPILRSAVVENLNLNRSHIPGFFADRIEARGNVFLRGTTVSGEARLLGAKLDGDVSCIGAEFETRKGDALAADRLDARGDFFLRGATVRGGARLLGVRLGGNLDCGGAKFERENGIALAADGLETRGGVFLRQTTIRGEARFNNARIKASFECDGATFNNAGGRALTLNRIEVAGAFFLRGGSKVIGGLDLTAAFLGHINDDLKCWPGSGNLLLDRCRYGAFAGANVSLSSKDRLEWLARQNPVRWGQDFWPQPYEQLSKVLREMGHTEDARAVLIEKERRQRTARRGRLNVIWRSMYWLRDGALAITVRYGRQPLWAFVWLAGFWLLGAGIFSDAARSEAIKPNNAFVLRSDEWALCGYSQGAVVFDSNARKPARGRATADQSQLACFLDQPEAAKYPRFNEWIYSLDTLVPVVDMEMQTFWIPDESASWKYASATRGYLWLHIAAGWLLSLLAIAGFSGLVKSD